jgi:hypothetical protein
VIKQLKLAIDYFTSRLPSLANIGSLFGISRASETRPIIFGTTADKRAGALRLWLFFLDPVHMRAGARRASGGALGLADRCHVQAALVIVFANVGMSGRCIATLFAAPSLPIESAREQEQEINRAEVPPLLFTLNYYFSQFQPLNHNCRVEQLRNNKAGSLPQLNRSLQKRSALHPIRSCLVMKNVNPRSSKRCERIKANPNLHC